ncbi:MAG: multifunctional CCA tRNA nucleotidyl transferase/2'3'-cyclic phosphodiesterase/2'nucleotidase/phosphatase, partial [Variovorax sp.]
MKTYLVGGALRDRLLGLPVSDRDWLVVGATPEEMAQRGYLPVGRDFPVFLHPQTREEYALARTERKSAPGYRGFTVHAAPDVTLEQDLARRDLTINSIALPAELAGAGGQFALSPEALVDPFHGQRDLRDKVLRHVTDAFREDPVRILRVARFAARFHQFRVAPETMALMREMVDAGEVDALVPERVWQELARGLMEAMPSRMFAVLQDCGALARLLPELDLAAARMQAFDRTAQIGAPLPVRFACLMRGLGPALPALCERWRVPIEERDLALLVDREGHRIDAATELDAAEVMDLLERCDAIRKPQRFEQALLACECGVPGVPRERAGLPRLHRSCRTRRYAG